MMKKTKTTEIEKEEKGEKKITALPWGIDKEAGYR